MYLGRAIYTPCSESHPPGNSLRWIFKLAVGKEILAWIVSCCFANVYVFLIVARIFHPRCGRDRNEQFSSLSHNILFLVCRYMQLPFAER